VGYLLCRKEPREILNGTMKHVYTEKDIPVKLKTGFLFLNLFLMFNLEMFDFIWTELNRKTSGMGSGRNHKPGLKFGSPKAQLHYIRECCPQGF